MSIFRAMTYIIAIRDANGVIKSQPMNHSGYTWLGGGFGKFYFVIIAMIIIVAAGQIILKYTRYGTNLYSVGASKKAATLSGIDVAKTRLIAYVITGFTVAVGAVFTTARLQSATTAIGMDFEFNPIAAAVVGGVALSGHWRTAYVNCRSIRHTSMSSRARSSSQSLSSMLHTRHAWIARQEKKELRRGLNNGRKYIN